MTAAAKSGTKTNVTFQENAIEITLGAGKTQFKVADNNDVTVFAKTVRSKPAAKAAAATADRTVAISDDNTTAEIAGTRLEVPANGTPVVVTTGVIRQKRPAAAAAPKAPVQAPKKQLPTIDTDAIVKDTKELVEETKEKATAALSEFFPAKKKYAIGDDTGDGWVCIKTPSLIERLLHGASAAMTVAKFVGAMNFTALEHAAQTEGKNSGVHGVHIANAGEINSAFNTVARLAGQTQIAWINEASNAATTAVSLKEQGQGFSLSRKKRSSKNAGILFGTRTA